MISQKEISSIVRASGILECLSGGIGKITDISKKLQFNKSSIHRILKTLETTGLAAQDPVTRQYYLGPFLQTLASNPLAVHQILIHCAHDQLEYLRDLSGETVGIQIRQGSQRMIIDEAECRQEMKYYRGKGHSSYIHAGASGKVLLSELDDKQWKHFLNTIELVPVGPQTITDKTMLLQELKKIRKQGYATSIDETFEGAVAIAVPIKNYMCPVALGAVGPENRFRKKMMPLLNEFKKSADTISNKLKKVAGIRMNT
ncbi:MAG: IclR family transcriptional regulator [Deltaproteobacteria bacterium]|nr:IclR family transcriptional regulator [Deltaproteobacteria bacterium]